MISKVAKLPHEAVDELSNFGFQNFMFLEEWIPWHSDVGEAIGCLRDEEASWSVLATDHPLALFKLNMRGKQASLEQFCPIKETSGSLENLISTLQNDLHKMGVTDIKIQVPKSIADQFVAEDFKEENTLVRFSGRPTEMKMMPMLRLSNATERDVHELAKLLYEAYVGSTYKKFADVELAALSLREIMRGQRGRYLSDASFISSASQNLVSACLITLDSSNEGRVTELFTHPLYLARGLATTELAAGMNWLVKNRIKTVTAWVPSANDVARRLFSKIGLKEDRQLVELVASSQPLREAE